MEGVLEQHRALHEERERLMELIAQEMVKKKPGHRELLNSDHRTRLMLDRYTEATTKLADLYEDKDGLRRQDITAIANSPFNEFYNRLRTLRDYHRKHPDDVAVPLSVQVTCRNFSLVNFFAVIFRLID
jgi:splicing factor 3A subunit 3